jgi:hypothetical protein
MVDAHREIARRLQNKQLIPKISPFLKSNNEELKELAASIFAQFDECVIDLESLKINTE